MAVARPAAITFDVGGTLIAPWPSVGHAYATVAARFGANRLDPGVLDRRFAEAWMNRGEDFRYNRDAWAGLVARVFDGVSDVGAKAGFFEALYEHFATAMPWRVFPDVLPTLTCLRANGIKLAVISNWDDRLRPLLSTLGLAHHFEAILVSAEEGVRKPDPALFVEAARRLGVDPKAAVHVGDSPREDAAGAQAAGMGAVLVDRLPPTGGDDDLGRKCAAWL